MAVTAWRSLPSLHAPLALEMINCGQQQSPAGTQFGLAMHDHCDSLPAAATIQMAVLLKPQLRSPDSAQCYSGSVKVEPQQYKLSVRALTYYILAVLPVRALTLLCIRHILSLHARK